MGNGRKYPAMSARFSSLLAVAASCSQSSAKGSNLIKSSGWFIASPTWFPSGTLFPSGSRRRLSLSSFVTSAERNLAMLDRLEQIETRYEDLGRQLADPR
jgi:hypothetical protein